MLHSCYDELECLTFLPCNLRWAALLRFACGRQPLIRGTSDLRALGGKTFIIRDEHAWYEVVMPVGMTCTHAIPTGIPLNWVYRRQLASGMFSFNGISQRSLFSSAEIIMHSHINCKYLAIKHATCPCKLQTVFYPPPCASTWLLLLSSECVFFSAVSTTSDQGK